MLKPFYTALMASAVFSTTLLVVAQQSVSVDSPVASDPATAAMATNPFAGNAGAIQAGGRLFGQACEKCHGPAGEGDPSAAPPLNTISFIHGYEDAGVFQTIRDGVENTEMAPHPTFTDEQTWQLVAFIKSLAGARDRGFTERYCVGCHGDWAKTAGLSLQNLSLKDIPQHGQIWEKVLRKVRSGEMPPARVRTRSDAASAAAFASFLETSLDNAAAAHPNPGRTPVHRLNRAEYSNAIRDLLAVDVRPGDWLPVDDSGYGFDNIAAVLSTSPALLERYMSAARKISRLAVGDLTLKPREEVFEAPRDPATGPRNEQLNEDLPFGSRAGMSVQSYFPVDAHYTITLRFSDDVLNAVNGAVEAPSADVYSVRTFVPAGLHTVGATSGRDDLRAEMEAPPAARGPAAGGEGKGDRAKRGSGAVDLYLDRARLTRFEITDGPSEVSRMVLRGPYEISGRGNAPSRAKIFVCRPATADQEPACARRILTTLSHRAFRRPVTPADIEPLYAFYQKARTGGDFDGGIEAALRAILVSPEFLFRFERDPSRLREGSVRPVTGVELASRLSFFLWSSIPDNELLGLAEQGRLKEPTVLRRQIKRMLDDPRSEALVKNFAGQWLQIRNVETVRPNTDIFAFDESLRRSFVQETTLLVDSVFKEDRSVLDLLDADYTHLNQRLAEHYGVPNVYGSHFRRVPITDPNRRGLLGQGSILTVTSYPNRTSVVQRGKWVLENLLGTPPPPPPPDVPDLKAAPYGKLLTMREQMQVHRANPICASCHGRMDPIGFALENFDGIGRWRDKDAGTTIDATGTLPDGTQFQGPAGLRKLLLTKYKEDFVRTSIEKLLTYALGRGLESYDYPTVREIARQTSNDNYRMASLVAAVVKSTPFQRRRVSE
jgi:mono/diheme cytochrome c family protein